MIKENDNKVKRKECYKTIVQPAMMGTKCWATTRNHTHKMSVTMMCILAKLKKERPREYLGIIPILGKIRDTSKLV